MHFLKIIFIGILGYFLVNHFHYLVDHKFEEVKEQQHPNVPTLSQRMRELDCLTKNIYYEAGTEPFEGKVAVAQVTINRTQSGKFPKDICAVVYERNLVYNNLICQFSWYCESQTKVRPIHAAMSPARISSISTIRLRSAPNVSNRRNGRTYMYSK